MGGKRWTSDPQQAFLEGFLNRLEEEKDSHGFKPFYARVTKAFIERWESPIPSDIDRTKITDEAELKRLADERRGDVSPSLSFPPLRTHFRDASKSRTGSEITVAKKKPQSPRPPRTRPFWTSPVKTLGSPALYNCIRHSPTNTIRTRTLRYVERWTTCGNAVRSRRLSTC